MLVALYSDPHFGHFNERSGGIIKLADRPFASVNEMDEKLIKRYNELISPDETVLWLGDAFLCPVERALEIMDALNGRKQLILGNHDRSTTAMLKLGFEIVMERECFMFLRGRKCRLAHYPYAGAAHVRGEDDRYAELRPPRVKGEVLIHGHSHAKRRILQNSIHVGVDAWDFRPVRLEEVEELIRRHL